MNLKKLLSAGVIVTLGAVLLSSGITNHEVEIKELVEPSLDAGASKALASASVDYMSEFKQITLASNDTCLVATGEMDEIYQKYRPQPEPDPIPEPEPASEPEPEPQPKSTKSSEPEPQDYSEPSSNSGGSTDVNSSDEFWLLCATVQAEGYTMHYDGMRLIACTILNRADRNGTSITDEICSGAYTVVNNGTIWRMGTIYEDTKQACIDELANRTDGRLLYFRTDHYHGFGTPLFHYGNVYFSGA